MEKQIHLLLSFVLLHFQHFVLVCGQIEIQNANQLSWLINLT